MIKLTALMVIATMISAKTALASDKFAEKIPVKIEYVNAIDTSEVALVSSGVKLNLYLENRIKYPALAIENGIEGSVKVLARVGTNGLVTDVEILETVDDRLAQEVIKSVKNLTFIPATQNGYAVSYTIMIPVKFDLLNQ